MESVTNVTLQRAVAQLRRDATARYALCWRARRLDFTVLLATNMRTNRHRHPDACVLIDHGKPFFARHPRARELYVRTYPRDAGLPS